MKSIHALAITLVLFFPMISISGEEDEWARRETERKLRQGLNSDIRAGLSADKMLDICIPEAKRTLGRFTQYRFVFIPNYYGLSIIAKDGVLKSAYEWSCTHDRRFFDELTAEDRKELEKLLDRDVPFESCHGRNGWRRPRLRDWEAPTQNDLIVTVPK
jgi:hypothetical protein